MILDLGWTFKPILLRDRRGEDKGRDEGDMAISQGMPGATRSQTGWAGSSPGAFAGSGPDCWPPDLKGRHCCSIKPPSSCQFAIEK